MNKHKILVVDDTVENIDLIVGLLKEKFIVMAAKSGIVALKITASPNPPDLILLDIKMPEMDGFEVCQQLKNNDSTASIPVIFVSGSDDAEEKNKAKELGAVNFLSKPIDPVSLIAAIDSELNNT